MHLHFWFRMLLLLGLAAGCVDDPESDSPTEVGGKGDESGDPGTRYSFHGRFRLFRGIASQDGELSGTFAISRLEPGQIEAKVREVTYELSLEADGFHSAYAFRSAPDRDRSWADWRGGLHVFIQQVSPLTAGAEQTVFDASAGTLTFDFFPFCTMEGVCKPGALSGFDLGPSSGGIPEIRIEPLGPFELVAD